MASTAISKAEARKHPRYPLALLAQIRGLSVLTKDVSRSGVRLWCPSTSFQPVFGKDLLRIHINLPEEGSFVAVCQMAYAREYRNEYLVGLDFKKVELEHWAKFERLIEKLEGGAVPG